jgi:hypothetical protein
MASKSYAWQKRLDAAVADAGTVDVPTPGFSNPQNYDTANTGVVLDGTVMDASKASCAWAGDFSEVTVTNASGADWNPGQTVYITVAGVQIDPTDIQASFDQLEQRVTNCESKDAAQDTRMDTLDARITALEGVTSATAVDKHPDNHAKYGQYRPEDEDHDEDRSHSGKDRKKPK